MLWNVTAENVISVYDGAAGLQYLKVVLKFSEHHSFHFISGEI